MAGAALSASTDQGATHLHPTSVTTNFVHSPDVGPAQLHAEVRRVGRGVSFVHVTLIQDDQLKTESLITTGTLHEGPARYMDATPPNVAPIDECHQVPNSDDIKTMNVIELRLDPNCVGWWYGEISERAELLGWMRLDDGASTWDPWNVLFASDAMPPATMPIGSSGWVPTLQLTSYVRGVPQGEWLRLRQWCVVVGDGLVDERCELFDERGHLVASSSQLAMVRFPHHDP